MLNWIKENECVQNSEAILLFQTKLNEMIAVKCIDCDLLVISKDNVTRNG